MDNKKTPGQPEGSDCFEDLLPDSAEEIGPDEHAVSGVGLSDLSDMELERIMSESLAEDMHEPSLEEVLAPIPEEIPEISEADEDTENTAPREERETDSADESEESDAPVRKVRPKRKGGYGMFGLPHLLSTAIWLALAIGIGISLGRFLWRCATDVLAFGREDRTIYVTITDSDNMDSITQKLYNAGLIEYPDLFRLYADISNAEEKISAGTFKLNSLYDYHALVGGMSATSSYRETVEVMIPEGYTCAQIFKLLEEKGVCTAAKLEAYAAESEFADYWFLEGVPRGNKYTLEGFLFPDTYSFYTNDSPRHVFIKFLDRFEDQLDEDLETRIATLNSRLADKMRKNGQSQAYIDAHLLDLYDIINIASMIEKESAHTGENYNVSSVIYNRLSNPGNFPYLNIDATIVYAQGGDSDSIDTSLDSPYNTYLYPGLPPTPISNPGLSAILAALSPADTSYYYYALNPTAGEHHFSETLKDHNDFLNSLKK